MPIQAEQKCAHSTFISTSSYISNLQEVNESFRTTINSFSIFFFSWKGLYRAKGKVWNPSSRMESVYRADFHANTSSLTHHYLVRALRIVFAFIAINTLLKKYSNSLCIVYEFGPKHRNGFSQSQTNERGRRDGSPVDLWSKKTIPEEWDRDWQAQKLYLISKH